MLKLRTPSPDVWLNTVLNDFDAFLTDHANCERKASATALQFASHYSDRVELVDAMMDLALEELEHYRQVYHLIRHRGLRLAPDTKDVYVRELAKNCRRGSEVYFLDRLLLAGIIEARGCERFGRIAHGLPPGPLKTFYEAITAAEARHHGLFTRLARTYFPAAEVDARRDELLDHEARIVAELPPRPALH